MEKLFSTTNYLVDNRADNIFSDAGSAMITIQSKKTE